MSSARRASSAASTSSISPSRTRLRSIPRAVLRLVAQPLDVDHRSRVPHLRPRSSLDPARRRRATPCLAAVRRARAVEPGDRIRAEELHLRDLGREGAQAVGDELVGDVALEVDEEAVVAEALLRRPALELGEVDRARPRTPGGSPSSEPGRSAALEADDARLVVAGRAGMPWPTTTNRVWFSGWSSISRGQALRGRRCSAASGLPIAAWSGRFDRATVRGGVGGRVRGDDRGVRAASCSATPGTARSRAGTTARCLTSRELRARLHEQVQRDRQVDLALDRAARSRTTSVSSVTDTEPSIEFSIGTTPSSHSPDSTAAMTSGIDDRAPAHPPRGPAWLSSASSVNVPEGPKNATGGTTAHRSGALSRPPRSICRPCVRCGGCRAGARRGARARRMPAAAGDAARPHAPGAGGTARAARASAASSARRSPTRFHATIDGRWKSPTTTASGIAEREPGDARRGPGSDAGQRVTTPPGTPSEPGRGDPLDRRRPPAHLADRLRPAPLHADRVPVERGSSTSSATVGGQPQRGRLGPGAGRPWRVHQAGVGAVRLDPRSPSARARSGTISSTGLPAVGSRSPRNRRCRAATRASVGRELVTGVVRPDERRARAAAASRRRDRTPRPPRRRRPRRGAGCPDRRACASPARSHAAPGGDTGRAVHARGARAWRAGRPADRGARACARSESGG